MITLALIALLALPAAAEEPADAPRVRSVPHNAQKARDPSDPSCAMCHGKVPETGAAPEAANLHMPPAQVCGMCHRGPHHHGAEEHLGKVVPEEARAALPDSVRLASDGTVQCWSCHEVHTLAFPAAVQEEIVAHQVADRPLATALQARSLPDFAEAGDAKRWPPSHDPVVPPLLALPIHDGSLCAACHGEGP